MSHVVITLQYGTGGVKDLAVPEDVPAQLLAKSLFTILKVAQVGDKLPALYWLLPRGRAELGPASTLRHAGVVNGSYLVLEARDWPKSATAYLSSETGIRFPLGKEARLGRSKSGDIEIDLSGLDIARVVSRKHGLIRGGGKAHELIDTNSKHGTWLNDARTTADRAQGLTHGDVLCFGPLDRGVKLTYLELGKRG